MNLMPIHLVIPMSGQGTRYRAAGYKEPKPLIPVSGVPMIERVLSCFPLSWPAHFVLAENHRESGLEPLLARLRPDGRVGYVPQHQRGPGLALYEALKNISEEAPIFVSYCDYGMVWDPIHFDRFVKETGCDACLVSYRGFHAHYLSPVKYAYSRLIGERVVEVREKGSFTEDRENEYASAGGYYFRSGRLLRQALDYQMEHGLELSGELYTSLTVEALLRCRRDADVRVFEIPAFFQWGTPEDLVSFEFWERSFRACARSAGRTGQVSQVLMPMAGLGSRFGAVTETPKPLIPVQGRPMFETALRSLPAAERTVVVALTGLAATLPTLAEGGRGGITVVSLKETPPGQALSVEAGAAALAPEGDVVVSACDHAIALPVERWKAFRDHPDCEAAIFTMRGFPGAARRPSAYAYVIPQSEDGPFPEVASVSVKRPVSQNPAQDHVLVGTFWFASAKRMLEGIAELKRADERVNGELYLDSVFAFLMKLGHRVRMIPLDGYICWGEPDALAEALYWQEVFLGRRIERRPRFPGVKVRA